MITEQYTDPITGIEFDIPISNIKQVNKVLDWKFSFKVFKWNHEWSEQCRKLRRKLKAVWA